MLDTILNEKQKAIAAAVIGFLTGFLSTLIGAMTVTGTFADVRPVTWLAAVLAGLGGLGVGGVATYKVQNRSRGAGPLS